MLQVKIRYGDEVEKLFFISDLQDLKRVQDNLIDDFQKVLAQDRSEEKIQLERILDASPCEDVDELINWIQEMRDLNDNLTCEVDVMKDTISKIYNLSREFY